MEMIPLNHATITIVYNDEFKNFLHQIANFPGKTDHESYNEPLNNLMAYDVFFSIYYPYEVRKLAKLGHLCISIQNPGYINPQTSYLITFPPILTEWQLEVLDSQEEVLKNAAEINFEIFDPESQMAHTYKPNEPYDFNKYKEFLELMRINQQKRKRTQ